LLGSSEKLGGLRGQAKLAGKSQEEIGERATFNTDELLDTLLTAVENEAKKESGWSMMNRFLKMRDRKKLNFRTIEVHEYLPGGGLPERKHYDAGSLITVDVILADGFEGGKLYCPVYGEDENVVVRREVVEGGGFSNVGDAVIFPSHKFHNVSQVTSGKRIVLVMEIWEGEAKKCFHRCLKDNNGETCEYNKEQFDLLLMMNTISMLSIFQLRTERSEGELRPSAERSGKPSAAEKGGFGGIKYK